ncbi:MAG: M48 family metalloprotease [Desulfopila sp.]
MKRPIRKLLAISIAALFFQGACLQPVKAFTITEEREVGEKLLYSVRSAFPLIDDPDLVQYLAGLGKEVLDVAGLQYFNYRFYIINDKEFNAFAAPSGLIFFYSGLIGSMVEEDELVSVLAHEIGHVVKRHLADRLEKGTVISAASIAVALAALALGGGAATQAVMTSSLAAGQSANLHFSRHDEEEADLLAYGWMKKMGRNPEGQKRMLDTMRRISRYRSDRLPQYLLTHPNPEARLDYVQALMKMDEQQLRKIPPRDEFAFLRFKYRVMVQSTDSFSFREYLSNVISDGKKSEHERAMARYGLSQLEMVLKNTDAALKQLEQVIAIYPDRTILLVDKGIILYNGGQYDAARKLLEQAVNRNPDDMYAAFYLAKICQLQGDLSRAKTLFDTVSYTLPEYSKVYFELGRIASLQQQSAASALYLGKYYLYEGKLDSAEHSFKAALQDARATAGQKEEGQQLLDTIERLKKN